MKSAGRDRLLRSGRATYGDGARLELDAKGAANQLFAQLRVPVTLLYTSGYWENLNHFGMGPQRGADGSLSVTFPTAEARIP